MENYVTSLDFIERAAVVAVKHPKWIERPIVIVQIKKYDSIINNELKMKKRIYAKLKEKYDILFWDQIPPTGPGKMSKKQCRERLQKENIT